MPSIEPLNSDKLGNRPLRPILKWAGGKSALLPQLLPLFPSQYNRYFEPFLGGGAVYFSLNFSGFTHLNDANREIIELYETVRDHPQTLMQTLDKFAELYSEEFYYSMRALSPENKIERAARTLFLNKTGFNGLYRQNRHGAFNVPFGKRSKCPLLYNSNNVQMVSQGLHRVHLSSFDFESIVDMAGPGDFVYCDPPYEPLSRTSSFNTYQRGGFSQDDQMRLKRACLRAKRRGATLIISNSSADFIRDLYSDCDLRILSARRAINSKGDSRGSVNEVAILF